MGYEMNLAAKTEKEVLELQKEVILGKNQCKSPTVDSLKPKNPSPASANSPSRSKKKKKNRRRKMANPVMAETAAEVLPVRRLFNTCKEVFADCGPGIVPSEEKIQRLRAILDDMKPEDVGLTPRMPYFRVTSERGRQSPSITYLHLYDCDMFSIGIFCLPPSGVIPLHNHPQMTVFSKLLFGTMHIKSYDWVADAPMEDPVTRLAKVKVDSTFTAPCNTSILYPADGGNMHCFTAETPCAVLDVLGPPYSDPEGRHCTYFLDFPYSNFSVDGVIIPEEEREGYAWLRERDDNPEDLNVVGALYRGPKVDE
ncbi:PREDICTED: plant cysteine oxidase 1 [Tarenaya hassleriana]|uniref:plant cysteine oxidase 1 n=1 Tax=Tarenaya hassleriana TaxID=28532 RepID=UPI00053C900E|nr:PREDICTED: plant cysteine oxidase 1 [Tarenaya hassleriana]